MLFTIPTCVVDKKWSDINFSNWCRTNASYQVEFGYNLKPRHRLFAHVVSIIVFKIYTSLHAYKTKPRHSWALPSQKLIEKREKSNLTDFTTTVLKQESCSSLLWTFLPENQKWSLKVDTSKRIKLTSRSVVRMLLNVFGRCLLTIGWKLREK